ncbi:MAG TPA: hypothetical protein ACQGQG_07225, partial [Xylella sp.]
MPPSNTDIHHQITVPILHGAVVLLVLHKRVRQPLFGVAHGRLGCGVLFAQEGDNLGTVEADAENPRVSGLASLIPRLVAQRNAQQFDQRNYKCQQPVAGVFWSGQQRHGTAQDPPGRLHGAGKNGGRGDHWHAANPSRRQWLCRPVGGDCGLRPD